MATPLIDSTPAASPLEAHIPTEQLEKARQQLELYYAQVALAWPGFIARPGQHVMIHAALLTFLCAQDTDDETRSVRNLAQLEAGT